MKRFGLWILLLVGLLLSGCEQAQPPLESTPEPPLPVWLQEANYPTYEAFFSEDMVYEEKENPNAWTVKQGTAETEYALSLDAEAASLYVTGEALETPEQVYASEALRECTLLGCDGRFACLTQQGENGLTTCILRLDLLTGELETVVQGEALLDIYYYDCVVYFAEYRDGEVRISRAFLPEGKVDLLHSPDVPVAVFQMDRPQSTLGNIGFNYVRTNTQNQIRWELEDPASSYRKDKHMEARNALWVSKDPFNDPACREEMREMGREIAGGYTWTKECVELKRAWLQDAEYPSYEALFSQDLVYEQKKMDSTKLVPENSISWVVWDENAGTLYTLIRNPELPGARIGGDSLYIASDAWEAPAWIGTLERLSEYYLLACDGCYAYFARYLEEGDTSRYHEIARLDLQTMELTTLVRADEIMAIYLYSDSVLYFSCLQEGQLQICRMYLPEQKLEVLCKPDVPVNLFGFNPPVSTLGKLSWNTVIPEVQTALEAELADPNSEYRNITTAYHYDLLWEAEDPLNDVSLRTAVQILCQYLYRKDWGGELGCYMICTCDPETGDVRIPEPGVTANLPELVSGEWMQLPGAEIEALPTGEEKSQKAQAVILGDGFLPGKLYLFEEGVLTQLAQTPVKECAAGEDAVYCITEENTLIRVSWDGKQCDTVYTGGDTPIQMVQWAGEYVYIVEGDQILEISCARQQYRVLIRQECITDLYCDKNIVSFHVTKERYMEGYEYRHETGEIEKIQLVIAA